MVSYKVHLLLLPTGYDMIYDIYLTAIGCIPCGSVHDYKPKLLITTAINTNNTSSKPFTILWADVRGRTVPLFERNTLAIALQPRESTENLGQGSSPSRGLQYASYKNMVYSKC